MHLAAYMGWAQAKHTTGNTSYRSDGTVADDAIAAVLPYNNTRSLAGGRCNRCKRSTTTMLI